MLTKKSERIFSETWITNKAKIVDVEIICIGTFWELSIYDIFSSTSQFGRNLVLEEAPA